MYQILSQSIQLMVDFGKNKNVQTKIERPTMTDQPTDIAIEPWFYPGKKYTEQAGENNL